MKPPQRIVVAVDFSDPAHKALDAAIELARTLSAEIHVVHAFSAPLPVVTPYDVPAPQSFLDELRRAAGEKLQECAGKASSAGLTVHSHLVDVPAAPAISAVAEEVGADLVVVGTRGLTGLKHVLLGSVAERVLRLSPCSVLAVK